MTVAGPWPPPRRVAVTGSTNADVAALARAGAAEGTAVVAAEQTAGRGRLGRSWRTPPGAGVAVSVLLRPVGVPHGRWAWLPLLAGLCVADVTQSLVATAAAGAVTVKWPNDVLLAERKVAGVLAERVDGTGSGGAWSAAVVGAGVNVARVELAAPSAPGDVPLVAPTSLGEHGSRASADEVAHALLSTLHARYTAWVESAGDPGAGLLDEYRARCASLGRDLVAHLPDGSLLTGRAVAVDDAGRLVVRRDGVGDVVALAAGDVVHARVDGLPGWS